MFCGSGAHSAPWWIPASAERPLSRGGCISTYINIYTYICVSMFARMFCLTFNIHTYIYIHIDANFLLLIRLHINIYIYIHIFTCVWLIRCWLRTVPSFVVRSALCSSGRRSRRKIRRMYLFTIYIHFDTVFFRVGLTRGANTKSCWVSSFAQRLVSRGGRVKGQPYPEDASLHIYIYIHTFMFTRMCCWSGVDSESCRISSSARLLVPRGGEVDGGAGGCISTYIYLYIYA